MDNLEIDLISWIGVRFDTQVCISDMFFSSFRLANGATVSNPGPFKVIDFNLLSSETFSMHTLVS